LAEEEIRRASIRVLRPAERKHHEPGERFVGRERELAQLGRALDKAAAGHGRTFLVSGEPGIGKTRLADEFSARAQARGLRVMWGRCWERGSVPAYWPIIQIIRLCAERPDFAELAEALGPGIEQVAALVPEIVGPAPVRGGRAAFRRIDPEQARFRLFDAIATLLKSVAQREPLVIVIDDLHDADIAALQMVCFLARAMKDSPVMLLGTHREAEVERSPELRALFAELVRESDQLPLRGLSLVDAAGLVGDRTGIVPDDQFLAMLHLTTGGNPLFLGGVVQTLMAEGKLEQQEDLTAADLKLPVNVRSAIQRQLSGLSERTNSLLAVASALGVEFELAPLERVAPGLVAEILECLTEAVAAGIVAATPESGGHWRFTHALIRAAIYEAIGAVDRSRVHKQIGEVLEDLYRADPAPHLGELAHHFRLGTQRGDIQKAIDYSLKAAIAAEYTFAYEQSIAHLEAALSLTSSEDSSAVATRASLLFELGRLNSLAGRGGAAVINHMDRSIAAYHALGDVQREAGARAELGVQLAKMDDEHQIDIARARRELATAEEVFAPPGNGFGLAWTRMGLALVGWQALDLDYGLTMSSSVMELSEKQTFTWISGAYFGAIQRMLRGRIAEAFELLDESEMVARRIDDSLQRFRTIFHQGQLRRWTWQPRDAMRRWSQGIRELGLTPGGLQHRMLSWCSGLAAVQLADLDLARHHLKSGPRMLLEGQIAFYAGEWDRAEEILTRGAECMRQAGARAILCEFLFWLSRVMRERGQHVGAEALLREGSEIARSADAQLFAMHFLPELASLHIAMGHADVAAPHLERCREIVAGGEEWFGLTGLLALSEGQFAASQGDLESAMNHLSRAEEIFRKYSLPWELARTLEVSAKVCAQSDPQIAIEKIEAALLVYRNGLAGQPWIDSRLATRDRLRGTSVSVSPLNIFHKQGEYWAISFGGAESNLKEAKGLHYIARLLHCPGEQVSAIDLAVLGSGLNLDPRRTVDLGDAGEVLDAKARADYKRRLDELREEIERLRRMNDIGATEKTEAEYEALSQQLVAAAGLGGHTRRTASHRERARVAVTKSIKTAIESIRACNPLLGRHLSNSIRTGHFCCYAPSETARWQL
jgi:tetratricopeptide (TPR) repeat protein